jgi:protein NrfD
VPDGLFGRAPHWEWLIVGYFFAGGLAGGCHALATIADLFGRGRHRAAANAGYLATLPLLVIGGILLVVDLKRPERFWHMLFMSERFPTPMFKWWSPMSIGSWALALFGACATVTFVGALADEGRLRARWTRSLRDGPVGKASAVLGGVFGFFVAGYTGVLLAVTNRPVWSQTDWWGALFVLSGISSAAALMTLLLRRRSRDPAGTNRSWLSRFDAWVVGLEALVIVALVVSLGPAAKAWSAPTSIGLALGAVALGIGAPLLLRHRGGTSDPSRRREVLGAVLVIVGGICLRTLVVIPVEAM